MPWHKKPKKDVAACEKPREGGKQPLIRGFPNEQTHSAFGRVPLIIYGKRRELGELKHLSSRRKRKQSLFPK